MTLRTATDTDIDAILDFWKWAGENTDRHDTYEGVQQLLARDPDALIIAMDGDEMVGTIIAGFDGWRCYLYRFAVHPQRRREGIGRLLLGAAEERLAKLGGRRADAMVLNSNELGQAAWTAAGYERQTSCARWVKPLDRPTRPA